MQAEKSAGTSAKSVLIVPQSVCRVLTSENLDVLHQTNISDVTSQHEHDDTEVFVEFMRHPKSKHKAFYQNSVKTEGFGQ